VDEANLAFQMPPLFDQEAVTVRASGGGYVRRVEPKDLVGVAVAHDLVLRVEVHPGDFVAAGDVLLRAWPADRVSDEVAGNLRSAVVVGDQRTPAQDIRFNLGQLTEIACLALSSGVNDLYAAALCVDRLGEGLALLAERSIPSPYRADKSGRLRVVASSIDLPALVATAFDPIQQNGATQPLVVARLLDALARLADRAGRGDDRSFILTYALELREMAASAADRAGQSGVFNRTVRGAGDKTQEDGA
jgi:uncharacterized membrane protein